MNDLFLSSDFIQANRVIKLTSPLGDDQLLPERMSVEEGVNQLFEIKLVVRAKREVVKPEELIGNLVTVDVEIAEGLRRPFNGLVTRLSEGPPVTRGLRSYTLTIRPQIWLLSRRSDCRIWMDKTAIEVLQALFSEHGLPSPDVYSVSATPPQHCSVQWNETDLDYVLRRFEERSAAFSAFQTAGSYMPTLLASCLSFTLSEPSFRASFSNKMPLIKIEAVRTRKAIPARFNSDVLRLRSNRDVSRFQPL